MTINNNQIVISSLPSSGLRIDPTTSQLYINNILIINRNYNFYSIKKVIETTYGINTKVSIEHIFKNKYDYEIITNFDYFKINWGKILKNVKEVIFEDSTNNIKLVFDNDVNLNLWKLKNE